MDFYIKAADASDFSSVFELWGEAFGDDTEYIKSFLSAFDTDRRLILGFYGETPCAFVCLVPVSLRINGNFHGGSYIYAACVKKSMRGRGFFRIFSGLCCEYIKNVLGDEFAVLIPSSESLFSMYRKLGFTLSMSGLLPLCHNMPEPVDPGDFSRIRQSDFDGNYKRLYDFYTKPDGKIKLCLDYNLFVSSLSGYADRGNIKYLLDFDTKKPAGYAVYEKSMLQNGKERINIYDIYFYGRDKGDIIYRIGKKLFDSRIREKALWRIFTPYPSEELAEAAASVIFADILFEG